MKVKEESEFIFSVFIYLVFIYTLSLVASVYNRNCTVSDVAVVVIFCSSQYVIKRAQNRKCTCTIILFP